MLAMKGQSPVEIAIVGGGSASVTAAFELTQPEPSRETGPAVASPELLVAPPRLTLELDSSRHLEVSVDLRPRPLDRTFRVLGLDGSEPALPRIQGVIVEAVPEEERVVIRLRVPESQPPGTYGGILLDERTGLPRGTLCVRVLP
jgi:hypothetical protein